jgi:hypothetical protein
MRPFYLEYVNGHDEWINLCQHKFQTLPGGAKTYDNTGSEASADEGKDESAQTILTWLRIIGLLSMN